MYTVQEKQSHKEPEKINLLWDLSLMQVDASSFDVYYLLSTETNGALHLPYPKCFLRIKKSLTYTYDIICNLA